VEAALAGGRRFDPEALCVVWAGGHDIGAYLDYGPPDLVAYPPAQNIQRAIEALADAGARHFLVGNIPDMGSTPAYHGAPKAARATELVNTCNQGLAAVAAELRRSRGLDFIELDGAAAFADIAANAPRHGIKVLGEAFLPMDFIDFANPLAPAKPLPENRQSANPDEHFSFWAVSAGAKVHRLLGERAAAAVMTHVSAQGQ
jgi:phospholipase/lecithinase/hemolysin